MTEPSQYFKGRTVQEQMNEVIGYVDTRAAEVATTAIASDVAQVHQDMLNADADATAAAASAAAAAGTLANAVKKTGEASQSIAGNIAVAGNLSGGTVTVPAPVNNTDAASKKYVDDADALKADITYVDAQDALKISINDINSYAVGLTGTQQKVGTLEMMTALNPIKLNCSSLVSGIQIKNSADDSATNPANNIGYSQIVFKDMNDVTVGYLRFQHKRTGGYVMSIGTRNSSGTVIDTIIADVN